MLFTGQPITAAEALAMGLVSRIAKPEELDKVTLELAQSICKSSLETLELGKKAFYRQVSMPSVADAYDFASQVMVDNMQLTDAQEGISAFIEKREPHWKN